MTETKAVIINTGIQEISIPVSKVIEVKIENKIKSFMYFEKILDGTFRMSYTADMLETKEN